MLADHMKAKADSDDAAQKESKDLRAKKKNWGLTWLRADQGAYLSLILRAWRHSNQISGMTLHYEKLLEFQMSKYETALEKMERDGAEAEAFHQQKLSDTKAAYELRLSQQ